MIVRRCVFAGLVFVLLEFAADQSDACAATSTTPGSEYGQTSDNRNLKLKEKKLFLCANDNKIFA